MSATFEYVFPSIRGVQAQHEFYVSMCPLKLIPRIFLFDEVELVPELRAQRILNKARVPEIARYILNNRDSYVFSAITASVDGDVHFELPDSSARTSQLGFLHIPLNARFIINDGQHRRAAIEAALRENPDLGDECIAVVFFLDVGLRRSQQMFADLNRHAIRPSKSIGVLYDHRDDLAQLANLVAKRSAAFQGMVETERSTLSLRSRHLFTLSAIYSATHALLTDVPADSRTEQLDLAVAWWNAVGELFPEWTLVRQRRMTAGDVRRDFIHSHGIALQALGRVGSLLLRQDPKWTTTLKRLAKLDWSRANVATWEGRAMLGGRVSKASQNITLTTNLLKQRLKLPLSPEEQKVESAFLRGETSAQSERSVA